MNNRQAGRRRGRGGQRQQGGGNPNRDSGNRIDNRARGNAAQLLEKYRNLAADAQRAGDRVNTEYYLQFADHYFRVLGDNRARFEERNRRDDMDGDDEDFEAEGSEMDERPRAQAREERPVRDRAPREDRGPREERAPRERSRQDGNRAPAGDQDDEQQPQAAEAEPAEVEPRAPRRRTRVARSEEPAAEAGTDAAIDADRLPPALSADGEAERPRRRRRTRTEDGETVTPAA